LSQIFKRGSAAPARFGSPEVHVGHLLWVRVGQARGHNSQKDLICLFYVLEHVNHFKARFYFLFFLLENDPLGEPTHSPQVENSNQILFLFFEAFPNK
jgi:hypothetical protein